MDSGVRLFSLTDEDYVNTQFLNEAVETQDDGKKRWYNLLTLF